MNLPSQKRKAIIEGHDKSLFAGTGNFILCIPISLLTTNPYFNMVNIYTGFMIWDIKILLSIVYSLGIAHH